MNKPYNAMETKAAASIPSPVEEALIAASKIKNSARLVLADYRNEKKMLSAGIVTDEAFGLYQQCIKESINSLPDDDLPDIKEFKLQEKASVFLSYNNQDRQTALQIRDELQHYNIGVKMDLFNVTPGQDIKEFIVQQTKGNNAVVMLISKNSLTSPWVSYESTLAMFDQLLNNQNIYYLILDQSCLDNDFSAIAFAEFDVKIESLRKKIKDHDDKRWDARHLHTDLQSLIDAQHQLGTVLQKLKTKAVNSIIGDNFKTTLHKIAEVLTK